MKSQMRRRDFSTLTSAAGLSAWLGSQIQRACSASPNSHRDRAPFRRCITLWMQGGPSQFETFDPKPGTETGGPFKAVSSQVPGMQFCETLDQLATRAADLCVLRCISSKQGEHERATHLLHTGFEPIASFPRPALGSFVSYQQDVHSVPGYVLLGNQVHGPAFLGTRHGPFVIGELRQTLQTIREVSRSRNRLDLIGELNRKNLDQSAGAVKQRSKQIDAVRELIHSPFATALDLSQESESTRSRYGETDFGRHVLTSRRLLESGVPYVEVQLPGWDTHVRNFASVQRLCATLQPAWCALIDDLKSSGLWEDTLVLWMGEFGRTPGINGGNGRDHFPQNTPVVMAGNSIGGRVIGSTGKEGRTHLDQPHGIPDLMYTLLTLLGIDAEAEFTTAFGSPTTATDEGSLIKGI